MSTYKNNKTRPKTTKSKSPRTERRIESETKIETNPKVSSQSVYLTNSRLVEDAGRLAFSQALGNTLSLGNYLPGVSFSNLTALSTIPGIAVLELSPIYGGSTSSSSPLNLATRKIYSFVRHANSGRSNYEAADLMLYILQMNEIVKMYAFLSRIYGVARTYNTKNRFYPKRVIEAMGVKFEHLIQNLADYRYRLNVFASKISSLNVPINMPIFKESADLFSHLYLDGEHEMSQTYLYTLKSVLKFDAKYDESGGALLVEDFALRPSQMGLKEYTQGFDQLNAILNVVLQDEDMNIMSGDLLKAYGPEMMLRLPEIPEEYTVLPQYDPIELAKIQNATIFNTCDTKITQKNQLLCQDHLLVDASSHGVGLDQLLNFKHDKPTPEEIVVATRFKVIMASVHDSWSDTLSPDVKKEPGSTISAGTHIITGLWIYDINTRSHVSGALYSAQDEVNIDYLHTNLDFATTVTLSSNFKNFPLLPAFQVLDTDPNRFYFSGFLGDIQNYTVISKETLDRVHEVALLSLFGF